MKKIINAVLYIAALLCFAKFGWLAIEMFEIVNGNIPHMIIVNPVARGMWIASYLVGGCILIAITGIIDYVEYLLKKGIGA